MRSLKIAMGEINSVSGIDFCDIWGRLSETVDLELTLLFFTLWGQLIGDCVSWSALRLYNSFELLGGYCVTLTNLKCVCFFFRRALILNPNKHQQRVRKHRGQLPKLPRGLIRQTDTLILSFTSRSKCVCGSRLTQGQHSNCTHTAGQPRLRPHWWEY